MYPGVKLIEDEEGVDFIHSRSGTYAGEAGGDTLELKVDVDRNRPFSKALNVVSGCLILTKESSQPLWAEKASAAYFRSNSDSLKVENRILNASLYVVLSDGEKSEGHVIVDFHDDKSSADVTINIGYGYFTFSEVPKTSKYFRNVTLDIDYVEEVVWPVIELKNYSGTPANQMNRNLSIQTVFEDAGLELNYRPGNSQKISDPTPDTKWSKADMYAVMDDHFNQALDSDENIWCMMATEPPDPRYMGFSFSQSGKSGFGFFTGHNSFVGIKSREKKVKVNATRRFLHYLVHECGHCLGLSHPFELGRANSLSWMNYAWKYDSIHGAGTFYDKFRYLFSDEELLILRHQPNKAFKLRYAQKAGSAFHFAPEPKSDAPDDDEEENTDEELAAKKLKDRILKFSIKFRSCPFIKGEVVEFEAILCNRGTLPCRIEPDLTLGGGNLIVMVTSPGGVVQIAKPFVTEIEGPNRQYITLGKPGSREHSNTYKQIVPLIETQEGGMFKEAGTYHVKAIYESGNFKVTSQSAAVEMVEASEYDDETQTQVRVSAILDGPAATANRGKLVNFWTNLMSKPVEEQILRLETIEILLKGMNSRTIEVIAQHDQSRKGSKSRKFERSSTLRSAKELIEDTDRLLNYCREKYDGDDIDEQHYCKLVLARAELLCGVGETGKAEMEYNQLVADFVAHDADFDFIKRVSNTWQRTRYPEKANALTRPGNLNYQQRVEKLIFWSPTDLSKGKQDLSGIGLGRPFSNFDDEQLPRSFPFVHELEKVEDDTDDMDAVLNYAEAVLQSQEVNHEVYQWALETYIVHSKLAKRHKIRYPDPPKRDVSMLSMAAITETVREGKAQEQWMHYWRCDADFNFHHRHWHAVYRGGGSFHQTKRQGELFGYMHAQLLARYDAERESWGLPPVEPYKYDEVEPHGFNAGLEFHEEARHYDVIPRPPKQSWTDVLQKSADNFEESIIGCFDKGVLPERHFGALKCDSNLAGHIIEASTFEWGGEFGSMHNMGHMAFCRTEGIPSDKTTYMGSTLTAVRDPIFFRWHKRVDDLYQNWNNRVKQELADDAPGVVVEPSDCLVLPGEQPPSGFSEWVETGWKQTNFRNGNINTFLKKPELAYEWDNKLDHEPFSLHIRLKRKEGVTGELALTIRVFICQERHINDRRKWIEMDKFVHCLAENEDYAVLRRLDREASVIKRVHEDTDESTEKKFVETVSGNCECGWPYRMMLPRGVKGGEKWMLGVFISDNNTDRIAVRTSCGSMSYCGTYDQEYPDQRIMGYPFSTKICIKNKIVSITEAAEKLTNFSMSPFEIHNDYEIKKPAVDQLLPTLSDTVWAPYSIVGESGLGDYSMSRLTGRFRVLLNDEDFRKFSVERIRISFKGRDDASYPISDVKFSLRKGNTLDIDESCNIKVTFNKLETADVPQDGILSDEIELPVKITPGSDYFVTFTLQSPGCYIRSPKGSNVVNSYYVSAKQNIEEGTRRDNWEEHRHLIKRYFRSLYCVECLQG